MLSTLSLYLAFKKSLVVFKTELFELKDFQIKRKTIGSKNKICFLIWQTCEFDSMVKPIWMKFELIYLVD